MFYVRILLSVDTIRIFIAQRSAVHSPLDNRMARKRGLNFDGKKEIIIAVNPNDIPLNNPYSKSKNLFYN